MVFLTLDSNMFLTEDSNMCREERYKHLQFKLTGEHNEYTS